MTEKRLTFIDKVSILFYLSNNKAPEELVALYETTIENIKNIVENQQQILALSHSSYLLKALSLPLKRGLYPVMENLLYCWYTEQGTVSNKDLIEKAKELLNIINEQPTTKHVPKFSGSNGWVTGFKKRFGIAQRKKKSNVNDIAVDAPGEVRFFKIKFVCPFNRFI